MQTATNEEAFPKPVEGVREDYDHSAMYAGVPVILVDFNGRIGDTLRFERENGLNKVIIASIARKAGSLTGAEVKCLRSHLGMTPERFANTLNIDVSYVRAIEQDHEFMDAHHQAVLRGLVLDHLNEKFKIYDLYNLSMEPTRSPHVYRIDCNDPLNYRLLGD